MSHLEQFYPGDVIAWTVALVLIQMTLVIAVAALVARLTAHGGAAARYSVWCCALVCVLLCPLLTIGGNLMGLTVPSVVLPAELALVPSSSQVGGEVAVAAKNARAPSQRLVAPTASDAVTSRGAKTPQPSIHDGTESNGRSTTTASDAHLPTSHGRFRTVIGGFALVWSAGVLFLLARTMRALRWVGVLRGDAKPLDVERYALPLIRVKQRLEVGQLAKIAVSRQIAVPLVIGLWRSTVLIPQRLLSTLSETELEDVLVHECAHAVRRDLIVGLLQRLLASLFWPHPLIYVLNRRLSRAREEVCDNYVLRKGNAGRYAGTLLRVAEHITTERARAVGIGLLPSHWKLEDRVAGLLNPRRNLVTRTHRNLPTALFAALAMMLIMISGVRLGEAATDEPAMPPGEAPAADADKSPAKPVKRETLERFSFDELIVKKESFVLYGNHTLTIKKDGSYAFRLDYGSNDAADYRLSQTAMAELGDLLRKANYLHEPPLEAMARDSEKGLLELIASARSTNPRDPRIRYWEAQVRSARAGIQMGSDGTWFTFTLARDGKTTVLSRYQRELDLPPIKPLVRFMDRIHLQEHFHQQISDDQGNRDDRLLSLNLRLDRALGRRDFKSPTPLLALDQGRFSDRLQELAAGDNLRSASRARRALRTIRLLPEGDFSRPSPPIPPAAADRLASFTGFWINLKGEGDQQRHLSISPDGWYEFWISGPQVEKKHRPVLYRRVGRLPRKTLDRLDELIAATGHFRSPKAAHEIRGPSQRGVYEMAVIHEAMMRRVESHRQKQGEEYDQLQEFVTSQIVGLMKPN